MKEFKIGDRVEWTSQAGGNYVKKEGEVVYVLRDGQVPYLIANEKFPGMRHMFDGSSIPGKGPNRVGYLVKVDMGPKAKARLYFPRTSKLELVSQATLHF